MPTKVTDREVFEYDESGRLTRDTIYEGEDKVKSYITFVKDSDGNYVEYRYDGDGNLLAN